MFEKSTYTVLAGSSITVVTLLSDLGPEYNKVKEPLLATFIIYILILLVFKGMVLKPKKDTTKTERAPKDEKTDEPLVKSSLTRKIRKLRERIK